jgi:hypothetical protein
MFAGGVAATADVTRAEPALNAVDRKDVKPVFGIPECGF